MIKLPYQFPDPLVEAAQRVREFQALPVDERVRQLFDVIETGRILSRLAPDQSIAERIDQAREAEWRLRQKELFERHGVWQD